MADQPKQILWMPYGYHIITIGLGDKNTMLHIPMMYDKLLQQLSPQLMKEVVDLNVEHLNRMVKEPLKTMSEGARRWLSMAS